MFFDSVPLKAWPPLSLLDRKGILEKEMKLGASQHVVLRSRLVFPGSF